MNMVKRVSGVAIAVLVAMSMWAGVVHADPLDDQLAAARQALDDSNADYADAVNRLAIATTWCYTEPRLDLLPNATDASVLLGYANNFQQQAESEWISASIARMCALDPMTDPADVPVWNQRATDALADMVSKTNLANSVIGYAVAYIQLIEAAM